MDTYEGSGFTTVTSTDFLVLRLLEASGALVITSGRSEESVL